jgi:hypothetical protein
MSKAVVQAPYHQLSRQLGYLKRLLIFPLSKIIDLHKEVLNFVWKEGESLGAA